MPDESSEMATTTDEVLQASPLLQRLGRRSTQLIGLINTRQFQAGSSRLPTAITQRFALLDRLQTRYGIRESGTATNAELALATPSQKAGGEQTHTFTSQAPLTPATTTTMTSGGQSSSPPAFRVSRKVISSAITTSADQSSSPPMFRVSRKAISLSTHSALSSPLITNGSENQAEDTETTVQRSAVGALPTQTSHQVAESSLMSNSAMVSHSTGLPLVRAGVTSNPSNILPVAETSTPLVLQKAMATAPTRLTDSTMESTRVNTGALATQTGFAESISRVQAPTIPLAVQRQPAAALIHNKVLTVPVSNRPHEHPLPIALEIPSSRTSPAQSTMVWRKSIDGVTANHNSTTHALPLAVSPAHHSGPWIARQAIAAPVAGTMPMVPGRTSNPVVRAPLPMAGAAPMVAAETNVAQLAEQVSRILCRQLTVERERRGIRK